jgi:hypothetical protein
MDGGDGTDERDEKMKKYGWRPVMGFRLSKLMDL